MKHLERALDHQNQFWKYLVNILAGLVASNIIGSLPLIAIIAYKTFQSGGSIAPNPNNIADLSVYGISSNLGLFLLMLPFVLALFTTIMLLKPLHKRSFSEVANGTQKIQWNKVFFAAGIWTILMAIFLVISYILDPSNFVFQFDFSKFIVLVLISFIFIPLQTTYEELVFRGYLGQAIGAWTKSRWLVIIIPALLFALMHAANPEVTKFGFWSVMPQYLLFGLLFGLITVLSDGIELSMGVHAANNIFLSLFITDSSSVLQTSAVFTQQSMNVNRDTIMLAIFGLILLFVVMKKYKLDFSILNSKIEVEADTELVDSVILEN